jgi:methylated-DNA-[protein]-cysteine S-methyltransferase
MSDFYVSRLPTPLGQAFLVTDAAGFVRALDYEDYETRMRRLLRLHYGAIELRAAAAPRKIGRALAAYFDGALDALCALPCATAGTAFQRQVWAALRTIPAGSTQSYGTLAGRIGKAGAARAVGLANGANPINIIVPCHRVISAGGALTGYGGGLARKQWLLAHESAV